MKAELNRICFIDLPGFSPLPNRFILNTIVDSPSTANAGTLVAARQLLTTAAWDIVVTNAPNKEIFATVREKHHHATTILLTDASMEKYSVSLDGKEDILLDHVIANRHPQQWTINELRVTLKKMITGDIFGIEKYLTPETPVYEHGVTKSADRDTYNKLVMRFSEEAGLSQHLAKLIFGITEELLMNAIYDAPVANNSSYYHELPRTTPIELKPHEYSYLTYGYDCSTFAVSVRDPFGALRRDKFFQYLKKVIARGDASNLIDTKKGGAGLGLFKILYSSHSLVCNIRPNKITEVIALIDVQQQIRDFSKMARSVHYFLS